MSTSWISKDGREAIIPLTKGEGPEPHYWGKYEDHQIHISRQNKKSDWYIWVYAPSGALGYDGYWRDSAGKTIREAVAEAIRREQISHTGEPK